MNTNEERTHRHKRSVLGDILFSTYVRLGCMEIFQILIQNLIEKGKQKNCLKMQ